METVSPSFSVPQFAFAGNDPAAICADSCQSETASCFFLSRLLRALEGVFRVQFIECLHFRCVKFCGLAHQRFGGSSIIA